MEEPTLAIGLGLLVSLVFTEIFGLSAGGMIVPGYLALHLQRPANLVLTLGVALLTFLIVRGVSHIAIVYGRRRVVLTILVGFVMGNLVGASVACGATTCLPSMAGTEGILCVIGYIVPGLIALWFDRQGLSETVGTVLTATVLVHLTLVLVGMEVWA